MNPEEAKGLAKFIVDYLVQIELITLDDYVDVVNVPNRSVLENALYWAIRDYESLMIREMNK